MAVLRIVERNFLEDLLIRFLLTGISIKVTPDTCPVRKSDFKQNELTETQR